jgi:hypothetical protein
MHIPPFAHEGLPVAHCLPQTPFELQYSPSGQIKASSQGRPQRASASTQGTRSDFSLLLHESRNATANPPNLLSIIETTLCSRSPYIASRVSTIYPAGDLPQPEPALTEALKLG